MREQLYNNTGGSGSKPPAFFHVAISSPLANASGGRVKSAKPHLVIGDIVKSLGKQHAYALVGAAESAGHIFNALLKVPTLEDDACMHAG